jgi:beta-N-acetylhexosaminidase
MGATGDPNQAYQQGISDAQAMKQMGFNLNLAPVVDVQTLTNAQYDNSTMAGFEYRMFGTTSDQVSSFAGAYLDGLQSQGIIGCLKHWPGLGSVNVDPHQALPINNRNQQELNNIEFAPYRTLLAKGNVDMIMDTHEMVPAYDPNLPASLSPILINQVLRQNLGYQGVIFTDALDMGALTASYSVPQSAVLAIEAGNDLLEGIWSPDVMQSVVDALNAAVASGQITKARIDQSVQRILALKIKYGLIQVPGLPAQG